MNTLRKTILYKGLFLLLLGGLLSCQKTDPLPTPEPEPPIERTWTESPYAFAPVQGIALLDLTARNGEKEDAGDYSRNLYSAQYILEVAGVPYFTTADLDQALQESRMLLFSSAVKAATFTAQEVERLLTWVQEGGVIVSPACTAPSGALAQLYGLSAAAYTKTRYLATWDSALRNEPELFYFDEPEELDFSLGNTALGQAIKTYGYSLTTAQALARFQSGEAAVTRNPLGQGCVYSFGLLWRDVIQRNQLNKDFSAQRSYSNDFEPTSDTFPLFVRSVYNKYQAVSVWMSTIPDGYRTVLLPTHDCDSRTAYEAMYYMSDYETSLGIKGHYFLTTHYYRDAPYLSAFYDQTAVKNARKLLENGHTVGSHSVCHFPDFDKTDRFPNTVVSKETYKGSHDMTTGISSGGSTWAEVVLSKMILEEDLETQVRAFRTGHLLMNKNIPAALETGGYAFSSCYGAGDVLTCFPYRERMGNDWAGRYNGVLQLPLHFSDVDDKDPIDQDNWSKKPERWHKLLQKLAGNYAPSMILIHPNRDWKMFALKGLVNLLDREEVGLWNFEAYGDFWLGRSHFDFNFAYLPQESLVLISAPRQAWEANPHLSFVIECHEGFRPQAALLIDQDGFTSPLRLKQRDAHSFVAY